MAMILNVIAQTMNAGGSAIVSAFDAGSAAFNCTMSALSPGEKTKLGGRIKELEKKINALSAGIAKESLKFADPAAALESPAVIALLSAIKELHKEIEPMKRRIVEIDAAKGVKNAEETPCGIPCKIARTITAILPGEKAALKRKIFANEKKIRQLYVDFAREVAKQPDPNEAIYSTAVAAISAKINELNAEISAWKVQLADLAKPKPEKQKTAEKKPQPDAKKPQPDSSGVAKFFINAIAGSVSGYLPGERLSIERKLAECDKKIKSLSLEVAKESLKYQDPAEAINSAPVIALFAKINDLKVEVASLNQRKSELTSAGKAKAAAPPAKAAAVKPAAAPVKEKAVAAEVTVAEDAVTIVKDEAVAAEAAVETSVAEVAAPVMEEAAVAEVPAVAPVVEEAVTIVKDESVAVEVEVEASVAEVAAPVMEEAAVAEVPVVAPVVEEAVTIVKDESVAVEMEVEASVAEEAVAPVVEEAIVAEVPAEAPVAEEAAAPVDASPAIAEEVSSAVAEVITEVPAKTEGEQPKLHLTTSYAPLESVAKLTEFSGIDPVEGSTPYVYSRTKWPDIPPPVLPVSTEEEAKAVVQKINGDVASDETITEEAATSSGEPSLESAVVEEPAVAVVDVPAESVTAETEIETPVLSTESDAASLEHPPFVPVPEAEEVFGVSGDAEVPVTAADAAEQAQPETSTESQAVSPSEELPENAPVAAVTEQSAETSPDAVPEPSFPVDADGVASTDHPPIIPGLRPDAFVKEESGSGFRTRLLRNQFSILTPASAETSAIDPAPPTRDEVEAIASTMQADEVEQYKVGEILENQEKGSAAEKITESKVEESEEQPEASDYFKKLSARRKALLSGDKDDPPIPGDGHSRRK